MSKKKEIKQLESLLEDALEHLRCDVRDGDLSDSVWAQDVDALMAGIRALKAQEVAETQPANATAKAELLRTLCKAVASHQNPWDVGIMDQLLAAWDAGAEIAVKAMQICFGLAQDIERLLTLAYLQGGGDDEQS